MVEAFGAEAFRGFINLTLNVYCQHDENRCLKDVVYSFNAKPVTIQSTFYKLPPKDKKIRIQGIGTIIANEDEIEYQGGTLSTKLNGSQTFDHLYDEKQDG